MILEIDPHFPQPGIIEHVLELIREKHAVFAYPTDTIYGLGCDIFDEKAVKKISDIKNRSENKNYSIMVSDFKMLKKYTEITDTQEKLLREYLPGPFTFIVRASRNLPEYLISDEKTVGIRIPRNRFCRELVSALKKPIITTSLNFSGDPVIGNPENMPKALAQKIDIILDAGELGGEGSTVVDLTGKKPHIIRQGKGIL